MDYLKNVFEKQGSLGSNVPGTDSKRLPPIAQEHFVVFDHDNDLRRLRLRDLEASIHSAHAKDRENLVYERDRLKRWIGDYDEAFSHLHQGEYVHESIRTLCPVTWKTLEIIFKHHIDYSV